MDFAGLNWVTITVIGATVLLVVIAYAALRNRVSRDTEARSEAATRELYKEEDRAHADDGNGRV